MKLSKADIELRLRESSRDNCINWRGAALRSGDNVQYHDRDKHERTVLVGQIIDIRDLDEIMDSECPSLGRRGKGLPKRWVLIRKRIRMEGMSVRRPDPVEYSNVPDSMKEIIDTDEVEWVSSLSIMSPCFIFHIDHLQKSLFGCKGMDKVYFVRFRQSRNKKLIPLSPKEWNSFYRDHRYPYEESYPERIWTCLITLKMEVKRSLCRGGQWNGRTISSKLSGFTSSFFGYLKAELLQHIGEPLLEDCIKTSQCKKVLYDNLSSRQVRVTCNTGIIRVLSEPHLEAVRKVLGDSFGVGTNLPVPSMRMLKMNPTMKPTVYLRNMDPVRIVSCIKDERDIDPAKGKPSVITSATMPTDEGRKRKRMKLLCSYRGLDIRQSTTCNGIPELSVQCRFLKVKGNSIAVTKVHGNIVSDCEYESDSSELQVEVGDYIKVAGRKVYRISDITSTGIVRCVSPTHPINDPIEITLEEANHYLLQSIK
jgi:hypothetical protein